jgi:hypothetical protein
MINIYLSTDESKYRMILNRMILNERKYGDHHDLFS